MPNLRTKVRAAEEELQRREERAAAIEKAEAARLAGYLASIRSVARIFASYNHKVGTLASYHQYTIMVDMYTYM